MSNFIALFWQPYLIGLVLAVLLPIIGCYLRLRRESLAALAYGQVGAAGALGALALGASTIIGGMGASFLAAVLKWKLVPRWFDSGVVFSLLLLAGWGISMLLTANLPVAERLGSALFEGQLYFADRQYLYLISGMCLVILPGLQYLGPVLLANHLYPGYLPARNFGPKWGVLVFDMMAAMVLAVAVMTIGVMASFAMVFVPSWASFNYACNWRHGQWVAVVLGLTAYSFAFFAALYFDQVFGPFLVFCLIFLGVSISHLSVRIRRSYS